MQGERTDDGGFAPIRSDVETVAARLARRGYDTAAVVGPNPFLTSRFGFDRGFAVFEHASEANAFALPRVSDGHGYGGGRPIAADLLAYAGLLGRPPFWSADELAARATHVLEQRRDPFARVTGRRSPVRAASSSTTWTQTRSRRTTWRRHIPGSLFASRARGSA